MSKVPKGQKSSALGVAGLTSPVVEPVVVTQRGIFGLTDGPGVTGAEYLTSPTVLRKIHGRFLFVRSIGRGVELGGPLGIGVRAGSFVVGRPLTTRPPALGFGL